MNRLNHAAIDTIARFRASKYPLKNVAQDIIKARKLNSRERKIFLDLVFRFSREIYVFYQFIDQVPFAKTMSVQEKDSLAINLFADVEVPPSLASLKKDYENFLTFLSDEKYLVALGPLISNVLKADFHDCANAIAKGLHDRAKKYLAVDRRYIEVHDVVTALSKNNIKSFTHRLLSTAIGISDHFDLTMLPKNVKKHVWMMDAGSQIVAELIKPKSHDKVLDLCAGEGGKARYITMNDCDYLAVDIDETRLRRGKENLFDRKVDFLSADGRALPHKDESFDWIIVDAPCTGVGVLRRHYDLVHRLTKSDLANYVSLQRELLQSAVRLLKPEGRLVYATCSLFKIENEQQIERIMLENSQLKPLQLNNLVGDNLKIGSDALIKNSLSLFPHIDDCDGFYCAAFTK